MMEQRAAYFTIHQISWRFARVSWMHKGKSCIHRDWKRQCYDGRRSSINTSEDVVSQRHVRCFQPRSPRAPLLERIVGFFIFPLIQLVIYKGVGCNKENAKEISLQKIEAIFNKVGEALADGHAFICGDKFTAADLTFVALGAPIVFPHGCGNNLPSLHSCPLEMIHKVQLLRDTTAGKVEILLKGMVMNPILVHLNLSHNRIADLGIFELSKYLLCEKCILGGLNLGDNYISMQGAKYLAEALKSNAILACMNLGYNNLGDDGGRAIFDALQTNTSLQRLGLGSCGVGEETTLALGKLISNSRSPLLYLDISANPCIGMKGGSILQTSMMQDGGKPPSYLDLQLCEIGDELEQSIAKMIKVKYEEKLILSILKNTFYTTPQI